MFYRSDNRSPDQLRPVVLTPEFISTAEGSVLIAVGNTRVICTASIEETVPSFMRNSGKGWISSEYSMLPRATLTRTKPPAPGLGGPKVAAVLPVPSTVDHPGAAPRDLAHRDVAR